MNQIDINKAKEYNESVKLYRNMASQLQAEIKVNREQLTACCAELSQELGIEVNESNLREVLESQKQKIESIMNVGNAVISKIKAEQNSTTPAGVQPISSGVQPISSGVQQNMMGATVSNIQDMFSQQNVQSQQNSQIDLNNLASQSNAPFFRI